MKIAILGAGAMGSLFACYLSKNYEVFLIDHRLDKVNKINKDGVELIENDNSSHFYNIPAYMYDEILPKPDIIFSFVKSIKNMEALNNISHLISDDTILVSLQNGYGNDKDLEMFQDKIHVVIGSTTHGSTTISYGKVFHAGSGKSFLGENDFNKNSLNIVKNVLIDSSFDLEISQDIERLMIEKLFINIGINAITALADKENSCIYKNSYAKKMSKLLVFEACQVFNLSGYDFDKEEIFDRVIETSKKTGKNTSSMRADLLKKNESEIDKINKVVVDKAMAKGMTCPYNETITLLIKAKEGNI